MTPIILISLTTFMVGLNIGFLAGAVWRGIFAPSHVCSKETCND